MAHTPYKKYYKVQPSGLLRPNKLAAGMTKTAERSKHRLNGNALSLAVTGTTDVLRRSIYRSGVKVTQHVTYTYEISDTGRRKLARLKGERS